jgi:hypothetical protein
LPLLYELLNALTQAGLVDLIPGTDGETILRSDRRQLPFPISDN